MTLQEVLHNLANPGATQELVFYESGSRAVAKRIGTDKFTKEQIDNAYQKWLCDPNGGGLKEDSTKPHYWAGDKPILITDSTDYDFFCQFSLAAVAYLDTLGFVATWYSKEERSDSDYRDLLCQAVYQHEDYEVQVVLRTDALLYKTIFDNIPYQLYHDFLWKSSPTKPDRSSIKQWFNTFAVIAKAVQELK